MGRRVLKTKAAKARSREAHLYFIFYFKERPLLAVPSLFWIRYDDTAGTIHIPALPANGQANQLDSAQLARGDQTRHHVTLADGFSREPSLFSFYTRLPSLSDSE